MKHLEHTLQVFEPISLDEMDTVRLMNRADRKFIFHFRRLNELLDHAQKYYQILEICGKRDFSYHTTYLDTNNYLFFNQHISSRSQRYKVRYRIYENTGSSFLEVKCKNQKDRTLKWRIKNEFKDNVLDVPAIDFLSHYIKDVALDIQPVLINKFNRLTLVSLESKERITIDYNVSFSCQGGPTVELPFLTIVELKRDSFSNNSSMLSILRKMQIRESSFSKYCVGNVLLKPMNKANILKSSLLQLKKIENDESVHSFV